MLKAFDARFEPVHHTTDLPMSAPNNAAISHELNAPEVEPDDTFAPAPATNMGTPDGAYLHIALPQGRPGHIKSDTGNVHQAAIDDSAIDYRTSPHTQNGQQRTMVRPALVSNPYLQTMYPEAHQSAVGTKVGGSPFHLIAAHENDFIKSSTKLHHASAGALETSIAKPNGQHLSHMTTESIDQYLARNRGIINELLSPEDRKTLHKTLDYEQTLNGNNAAIVSDLMRYLMLAVAQKQGKKLVYNDLDLTRDFHSPGRLSPIRVGNLQNPIYQVRMGNTTFSNALMATHPSETTQFINILQRALKSIRETEASGYSGIGKELKNIFSYNRIKPKVNEDNITIADLVEEKSKLTNDRIKILSQLNLKPGIVVNQFRVNRELNQNTMLMQMADYKIQKFSSVRKLVTMQATGMAAYHPSIRSSIGPHQLYAQAVADVFNTPESTALIQSIKAINAEVQRQEPRISKEMVPSILSGGLLIHYMNFLDTNPSAESIGQYAINMCQKVNQRVGRGVQVPQNLIVKWLLAAFHWDQTPHKSDENWD